MAMAMECMMNVNDHWIPTVWVSVWEDDCGNPCVCVNNHTGEYLACHGDGKHVFWNEIQDCDAWAWEMWYPEVCDDKIFLKSYHDTYMVHGEDRELWQTDERSNVYLEDFDMESFERMMNGGEQSNNAYDRFLKETFEKKEQSEKKDEKPKRTMDPEVQRKAAIARKVKSFLESECKSEFDGLKGKEKTAKKTELYQKHKKENSDLYKKLCKKAEKEA